METRPQPFRKINNGYNGTDVIFTIGGQDYETWMVDYARLLSAVLYGRIRTRILAEDDESYLRKEKRHAEKGKGLTEQVRAKEAC